MNDSPRFLYVLGPLLLGVPRLAWAENAAVAANAASTPEARTAPVAGNAVPGSPPTATSPASDASAARRPISKQQAVALALKQSPTLQLAKLDVKTAKQQVLGEQGRYPYHLNADAGITHSTSTQLRADDTVSSSSSESLDAGIGVRRQFAGGTLAEVRAENQYFHLNGQSAGFGVTPFAASGYGATLRASVTQPLLRGYGTRVGEAELRAARVAERASEKSYERTKSSLVGDVLSGYFELWYASRAVEIEKASLELAREQLEQARDRLIMGAISKVDLLSFQTSASELEESLLAAELSREQRSLQLSQLMGQTPLLSDLYASTPPELDPMNFDEKTVASAMRNDSIELAELEQQVKLAKTRAEVAGENWRPQLDLEAWATSSGVSTEFPNAWARAARGRYWSAHGGIVFDLPLDDSAKRAEQMRAQLAVQSARQQLDVARARIASDAASAIASERTAHERLESARRTTAIANETYLAERERYQLGQTIVIQVQQAEAALRRAKLREARAQVDAAQARLILLHLTGQLLSAASAGTS